MKLLFIVAPLLVLIGLSQPAGAADPADLDTYLREFNYEARRMMKCSGKELLSMLIKKEAVLVDIRFPEEQMAWGPSFAMKIPLNELPDRLNELPRDKVIVTACPHIDRSSLAMLYLASKGYVSCYLVGGLVGLAEQLRGEEARDFIAALRRGEETRTKPQPQP